MSFDNIPSKSEVMGWDPPHLADFLRRRDLSGCDKVVMKCGMNGQRFLNMSDNDLQKFPKLHAPLISKISREINKKEEKRGFFQLRSSAPKYQEADLPVEDQGWGSEEFESDDDYESPNSNDEGEGSGGDYESAADGGVDSDNDYEPPPSEPPDDLQHHQICVAKHSNSEYIDRSSVTNQPPVPPARPGPGPGPPLPAMGRPSIVGAYPRSEQSPQRTQRPPPPDRSKKPGSLERTSNKGGNTSNDRNTKPPVRNAGLLEPPRMPKPPVPTAGGVRRSASSVTPGQAYNRQSPDPRSEFSDDGVRSSFTFPHSKHARNPSPRPQPHGSGGPPDSFSQTASLPSRLLDAKRGGSSRIPPLQMRPSDLDPRGEQGMDPTWYVGQVTRGQAEGNLRHVNMDGAFLVRDSSKGTATQPYTLMVLYQSKVFNIQIRKAQDGFLLGTGLKSNEVFKSVSEIINQHMQMPLLLIDAKNRGTGQQNQCALLHPAGF
ncbi:lymphocyte cytosolic protein 2a isoform X1 [Tachysurus fulvidraco]|uniref:lymphocyte cytosolic protein 2a isoform X1 n=1 Tax=Tachysurus fulvidraco TaxID=1234273 RepID=UPI000F4E02C2|nr:lymphocyte cytosolic protein 2a isoform X1 [Tachysurus fulvidraco]